MLLIDDYQICMAFSWCDWKSIEGNDDEHSMWYAQSPTIEVICTMKNPINVVQSTIP